MEPLLKLTNVKKSFGDIHAIEQVNLDIHKHSVIGLVGGNGAGKTTLLRLMSGVYRPTSGSVELENNRQFQKCARYWASYLSQRVCTRN